MLTYEQNVKAILESVFAGYKDELIEIACEMICTLTSYENPNTERCKYCKWRKDSDEVHRESIRAESKYILAPGEVLD